MFYKLLRIQFELRGEIGALPITINYVSIQTFYILIYGRESYFTHFDLRSENGSNYARVNLKNVDRSWAVRKHCVKG